MADTEETLKSLTQDLGDLGGLPADVARTVIVILAAVFRLIRNGSNNAEREDALYTIAEETKRALDKRKFPGQEI